MFHLSKVSLSTEWCLL